MLHFLTSKSVHSLLLITLIFLTLLLVVFVHLLAYLHLFYTYIFLHCFFLLFFRLFFLKPIRTISFRTVFFAVRPFSSSQPTLDIDGSLLSLTPSRPLLYRPFTCPMPSNLLDIRFRKFHI